MRFSCIGEPIPGVSRKHYGWQYTELKSADNGKLYAPPLNAEQVLEIDPTAGATRLVGDSFTGDFKWLVAERARNGRIYAPPCCATQTLEIDPSTGSTSLIGEEMPGEPDKMKYRAVVRALNGKLYAPPYSAGHVLEIDPDTRTACTIGPELLGGGEKYLAAALADTGKIYAVPASATHVLEIDPDTRSVALIGEEFPETWWKKYGVVASACGRLYAPPCYARQVLEIDPITRSAQLLDMASDLSMADAHIKEKYWAIAMAGNGRLYSPPCDASRVLEIDPVSRTASLVGQEFSGMLGKYWVAAAGRNGCVYAPPYNGARVLEISPGDSGAHASMSLFGPEWEENRKAARYQSIIAHGGCLYAPPTSETRLLEIDASAREARLLSEASWEGAWKKYVMTTVASGGRLYSPPCQSYSCVLEITPREASPRKRPHAEDGAEDPSPTKIRQCSATVAEATATAEDVTLPLQAKVA